MRADSVEGLLRRLAPEVLAVLLRRHSQFDACEDAVQEALLAAALQWPAEGVPEHPRAWLITVASRRLTDAWRAEHARRDREHADFAAVPASELDAPAPADEVPSGDDTLTLLLLCCHPSLSPSSQLALTLRAVGGLTTTEIARAFLVPDATMGQRISRAKATIKDAGASFSMPPDDERDARLKVVLHVLYVIFNEGYTATSGPSLQRRDLATEAIRLTRLVHRLLPADGEVAGLLALMLLTEARHGARTSPDGSLIPLAEQDRSLWRDELIREGSELIAATLPRARVGPYQLQAAIAAVHAEAPSPQETDWPQVLALYELLERVASNPMATLNRAVALAMVHGPHAGLDLLATLDDDERLAGHHRLTSVRAHLLELAGDTAAAREAYKLAARQTTSVPEQRHLERRAARLGAG
ncbi:MAG TPA: sigma-70 family RNA polymerase sigma factor [Solirubrobacteraceae bacterium]|nr:sigma-70 family RNA polymerase sigma factor [Solirubrobacteraceae bacterium]